MEKAVILFADNDKDFLRTCIPFLEAEGHHVIPATSPVEARQVLSRGGIDLAILDVRLEDDTDEQDISGITVAKEADPVIPKIIFTNFPTADAARESLMVQASGLPAALDFLSKQDDPDVLVWAARRALGTGRAWLKKVRQALQVTDDELQKDYADAKVQARLYFLISLVAALLGGLVILAGIILALLGLEKIGVAGTVAGIISEAFTFIYFHRADAANDRMDCYHARRLEGSRFELLLSTCDGLEGESKRSRCREHVIRSAAAAWFSKIVEDEEK